MPIKAFFFMLLPLCFLSRPAQTQTIADSSQYRQVKLGIWCETTRFIYVDNGADSLLQRLDCRNWEALRSSLQRNALGERAFFEAVEKPAIYAGYTTYDAKLSKLIEEISKKLKSAPGRRSNEARLQGVDSLQRKLAIMAVNPQTYAPAEVPEQRPTAYEEAQRPSGQQTNQSLAQEAEEETVAEAGMPLLEIVQWGLLLILAALLGWMFKRNAALEKELNLRMAKRKQEIATLAVKKDKDPLPVAKPAPAAPVPAGLEEKEVLRLIRKELDRFRQQQQKGPS